MVHRPGIEPGPPAWQASILPLNHRCPAISTCEAIECVFCLQNILNPECSPYWAWIGLGGLLYCIGLMLYCCFQVQIRLGDPIRVGWRMLKIPVRAAVRFGWSYWRNNTGETNGEPQHRRHSWALRVRESIVLFTIILLVKPMHGCQEVEVINQATKECILNENEKKCTFFTENIIHLNQVQREACIRMNHNGTTFQELRAKFVETKLRCLKESVVFTKDVEIKVWSTKRCPHMGSCTDEKCAKINRTSRIPELEHTHGYVGTTACVESCGGPGCDCFFPSSACLFYRIYAVPKSNDIFEVFKCIEWSKSMKIHVTTTTLNSKTNEAEKNKVELLLNQPVSIDGHTITASSIITTPSPILDTWFIRNGTDTATWSNLQLPAFQCYSEQLAIGNNCQLNAPCQCAPIESEVRCTCPDHNLTEHFNTIQYRLPIQKGHWKLTRQEDSVIATSGEEISTEIVIRSEGEADIEIMKDEDQCSVEADHITGCYSCAEGGQVLLTCTSKKRSTIATIQCGERMFTVPCSPKGIRNEIHLFSERAQFHERCVVTCGSEPMAFQITGILKYTGSIWTSAYRMIEGNSSIYNEINLPDLSHLGDGFGTFLKTGLVVVAVVAIIFLTTYLTIFSCFTKAATTVGLWIIKLLIKLPYNAVRGAIQFFWDRRGGRTRHKTPRYTV